MIADFFGFLSIPIQTFLFLPVDVKINIFMMIINILLGIYFLHVSITGKINIRTPKLRLLMIILAITFIITEISSLQTIYLWSKDVMINEMWIKSGDALANASTRATEQVYMNHVAYVYNRASQHLRSLSYLIFFLSLHFFKGTYRKWQI